MLFVSGSPDSEAATAAESARIEHIQVASGSSAAAESSTTGSLVPAGVRGLKFTVVPVPAATK